MSKYIFVKSGAWNDDTDVCRSAYCDCRLPAGRFRILGLRLALDTAQSSRAIRGGSWIDNKSLARSAYRSYNRQGNRGNRISLRLGMSVEL